MVGSSLRVTSFSLMIFFFSKVPPQPEQMFNEQEKLNITCTCVQDLKNKHLMKKITKLKMNKAMSKESEPTGHCKISFQYLLP